MTAFGFREFTNLLNKDKRLPEIAKPEAPLDAVSFLRQLPVWGLCVKELSLLAREWRNSPATRSAGFASKSFSHQSPAPGFGEKYWSLSGFPSHSFQSGGGVFLTLIFG